MVVAFIITDPIIRLITIPIADVAAMRGETDKVEVMFTTITGPFDLRIRIAFATGLLISAPVWLWQIWAFVAPLDEGVPAPGTIAVESKRKIVQHLTGGIIKAVLVKEAQEVHAGDPLIMAKTVALCKKKGVAVGAHPGYPDLLGFGRRALAITPADAEAYVLYQVGALQAFCHANGVKLQHVKLHGAFYNTACVTPKLADAVLNAIAALPDTPAVMEIGRAHV